MLIRPIWQDEESVCTNTEEVLASFQEVNERNIKTELLVGSADVKALYPSLNTDHTAEIVGQTFYESEYNFNEIDERELSLYLAINLKPEELEKREISQYCHKRRHKKGAPPKITGCAIDNKIENRYSPWLEPEKAQDERTTKKMISIALEIVIKFIMNNHIYKINGICKRQTKGGPIGLELTGDIAQIYMVWWDKELKKRLYESNIILLLYKRYVDDINMIINKMKAISNKRDEEEDKNIMDKVRQIANSIHESIQIETDTPAQNKDKKMPILDIKAWTETRTDKDGNKTSKILHEFYHKEIGSKEVTNSKSAMNMNTKRNILIAEMLRVLLRCSPLLDWKVTAEHASTMNKRIQNAGYNKTFRKQVTKAALKKYKDITHKDETGECPRYRNKTWQKTEREKKKQQQKTKWYKKGKQKYKSVIFVPATPHSKLQKEYKKIIDKHQMKIKVIEKAGTQLKNILQKSDPFKENKCNDPECFPCKSNDKNKPTNCRKDGIVYNIICQKCQSIYIGESSRNAISRGKEHKQDFDTNKETSIMLRHIKTHHQHDTNKPEFKMIVTHIYNNNSMDRQISEAIQINNIPKQQIINTKIEFRHAKLPRQELTWV